MDNAIDSSVARMTSFTFDAAETMCGQLIDLLSAMAAKVWTAKGNTEAETNSCSDNIIVHPQAEGRDGKGL